MMRVTTLGLKFSIDVLAIGTYLVELKN